MPSIGIVGCGAVTHLNYGPALATHADRPVRYVFDVNAAQADSAARLFGCEIAPLDELVDAVDLVVVATPPWTHSELVHACLRTGKAVLCEKPFMLSHTDAVSAVDAARTLGAQLYVSHHRRTYPQVRLARQLVGLGIVGDVVALTVREGGRLTWRTVSNYLMSEAAGGGVMWDTGAHTLDMALYGSGLDALPDASVNILEVDRDKPEPSNHFRSTFTVSHHAAEVSCRVELSRTEALPSMVEIRGTEGRVAFLTDADSRVRLTTAAGSEVLSADPVPRKFDAVASLFDRLLTHDRDEELSGERFLCQVKILEAIVNA